MKKIITLGVAVVLLAVSFLFWQHFHCPSLTGTWSLSVGAHIRSTSTINPDGSYMCQVTGLPNGQVANFAGTMKVKDGFLIDTVTSDSQAGLRVPRTTQARIVRFDDHELVVKDGNGTEYIYRKVEK